MMADAEIEKVAREIDEVLREIAEVQGQIKAVEKKLEAPHSSDDVSYLRKEKTMLLDMRNMLMTMRIKLLDMRNMLMTMRIKLQDEKTELTHDKRLRGEDNQPGEIRDRSETWIKHMLLPQLPELPTNRADLTNLLFPSGQEQKLPVTKLSYKIQTTMMPDLAKEVLIEADDSRLACAVSSFLYQRFCSNTEMHMTIIVVNCFNSFFDMFDEYTKYHFELTLDFNSSEKGLHSHSEKTEARSRPDTVLVASGCTFLMGEYTFHDLYSAEQELRSKVKPLNPMFYGRLKFIVGYIAAGSQFQLVYIGRNGSKDLHRIGAPMNLWKLADRCRFLLSLGYLFQLFQKMADSVPDVPGRRAMFSVEESSSKKRTSYFYANKVVKHIRDFWSYSLDQGTDLPVIAGAYTAARGCRFLLQSETGPSVSAHGTYRVECTPLGYTATLESEQDCRWMAQCLCGALCVLHKAGLVHRDIRLPNIVRLSETEFMLIDFESVAQCPFRLPIGFRRFHGWHPEMLEGNTYTPHSDMYSLGKLLEEALPIPRTLIAEEFVRKLTNKQLSASDALQDPWLSGP